MQHAFRDLVGLRLSEVLPSARFFGGEDVSISSCCNDSRRCRIGDLFVAILGPEQDGHDHVQEAIERGASAVMAERYLPIGVPLCIVKDTREAYGQVCQALVGKPTEQMKTIGVTGTNGKTTTALLLQSILAAADLPTGCTNTIEYFDGCKSVLAGETTPPQTLLAKLLGQMWSNGCSHAIVEASSTALAQRRLSGVEFDVAIVTNVRRDHIDYHTTAANYRRAKVRLLEQLKPDGVAIVNADDSNCESLLNEIACPALTFGVHAEADVTATVIERCGSEQTFLLAAGNETVAVRTRMIGNHHVSNCLAAAAAALVLGVDLQAIARGLESLERIPGRLEPVDCGQSFGVFVDSAHTPDSLAVSLKALRQVTSGRLICVFGASGDRNPDNRPLLGRIAERTADVSIITTDNPGHEDVLAIAHDIMDGYDRPARARLIPNRTKAIQWAVESAQPGDTVLIAGKGHEQFQIIGHTTKPFDDREVAKHHLYRLSAENRPISGLHLLSFADHAA